MEVRVPTYMVSRNSGTNAEATDTAVSGATKKDWVVTEEVGVVETVATAEKTDANTGTAAGTRVRMGAKGIHPPPRRIEAEVWSSYPL